MISKRIFGITGWKNSGKTTLAEKLIRELTARGWRTSSIKHAHHNLQLDLPGTDSYRHRMAGTVETAIISSARWALVHELRDEQEPELEDIVDRLSPCDIIIVEGYKNEDHPKIECRRGLSDKKAMEKNFPGIIAIAADHEVQSSLPSFNINDISAIASFVEKKTGLT